MPELPDVWVYCEKLTSLFGGQSLVGARLKSPFLLRTTTPPLESFVGPRFLEAQPLGKRLGLRFDGGFSLVIHLMVAGRLRMAPPSAPLTGKASLFALDFPEATVVLTEQGTKRRASLQLFDTWEAAQELTPLGLNPISCSATDFLRVLGAENRTLKRFLTDQRLLCGIGNAYSDEILFAAELGPVRLTQSLSEAEGRRLHGAVRMTLLTWLEFLRNEAKASFPARVTAFRPEMKVHGRFKQPCKTCGTAIQRIRYKDNETNYCPRCQTGGRVLADRSLSKLLRKDWPRRIEELEGT